MIIGEKVIFIRNKDVYILVRNIESIKKEIRYDIPENYPNEEPIDIYECSFIMNSGEYIEVFIEFDEKTFNNRLNRILNFITDTGVNFKNNILEINNS